MYVYPTKFDTVYLNNLDWLYLWGILEAPQVHLGSFYHIREDVHAVGKVLSNS